MTLFRNRTGRGTPKNQAAKPQLGACLCWLLCLLLWGGNAIAQSRFEGEPIDGTLTVTVVEAEPQASTPVKNAFVMVGREPGDPFSGNFGFTGADGAIAFRDPSLQGPQIVTATAEGYQVVTFVEVNADSLTLALAPRREFDPLDPPDRGLAKVSGKAKGFNVNNGPEGTGNGELDAGIVHPLLSIEDLLSFDASAFLAVPAPFQIAGDPGMEVALPGNAAFPLKFNLPGNIALPVQSELYSLIQKPEYQVSVRDRAEVQLGCLAGRIKVDALLEWMGTGGTVADLIPLIRLYKAGVSDRFAVSGPAVKNVSLTSSLGKTVTVNYDGAPESYPVLIVAAGDLSGAAGKGAILPFGFALADDGTGYGTRKVQALGALQGFPNMSYLYGAMAADLDAGGRPVLESGLTAVVDRAGNTQPSGTVRLDSFFNIVDADFDPYGRGQGTLWFTDAYRGGDSSSPEPSLSVSRVLLQASLPCGPEVPGCPQEGRQSHDLPQWVVVAPGNVQEFTLPVLPPEAPPFLSRPADQEQGEIQYRFLWDLSVYGLTLGDPFDFSRFDASTLSDRVTHLSRRCEVLPVSGLEPDQPRNLLPADGTAEAPLPLVLSASVFSDPDAGDAHTASRWQVWPEGADAEEAVLDQVVASGDLTRVEIALDLLEPGRGYVWRVRYRDDRGMWSRYSAETSFAAGCRSSAICDDGLWCNGAEQCVAGECRPGTPPNCDDKVGCTVDSCNEETDSCNFVPRNELCDDGKWCNGSETCDAVAGCRKGVAPNCNDKVSCTIDYCDEKAKACGHFAWNLLCTNFKWCDGEEICDSSRGCQAGTPPNCDDGILCTVDTCSDAKLACVNTPDHSVCGDGKWCNGIETCDAAAGCRPGVSVACEDGLPETRDICNEEADTCENLTGVVALSHAGSFGLIPDGDQEHPDRVVYTFKGVAGEVLIRYTLYDVDSEEEIQIHLNGRKIGTGAPTPDNRWGEVQELLLSEKDVYDADANTLVFANSSPPESREPWGVRILLMSIHLPNGGEYGKFDLMAEAGNGMQAAGQEDQNEAVFSFDGVRGDVLIEYEAYDIDSFRELQILLNGKEVGWVSPTGSGEWGRRQQLLLPDAQVLHLARNFLTFRYQPLLADAEDGITVSGADWGVRKVSVGIALPAAAAYGKVPDGDQDHAKLAMFSFGGKKGDVLFEYEAYDLSDREIQVLINGKSVGYLRATPARSWGGTQFLILKDTWVNDSSLNVVALKHLREQPGKSDWGVRRMVVKALQSEEVRKGPQALAPDADSPFGLDYIFPLDPLFRDPELARQFGGVVGVRWVNFSDIQWDAIENFPPVDGVHRYNWSALDDAVRQWQEYGVGIMMGLRFNCYWATREKPEAEFVYLHGIFSWIPHLFADYLPKEEHWQNLRDWVSTFVERYDGDGFKDMPGLRYPIHHYQMGNEYYNEMYWAGPVEHYELLLREVARSARQASPDVKIILSGVGFEEVYPFYGETMDPLSSAYVAKNLPNVGPAMRAFLHRGDRFSTAMTGFVDSYDILDARWPDYGAMAKSRQLLTELGHPEKEIWSSEIYTLIPFLDGNTIPNWNLHAIPSPSREMEYLVILRNPNHPEFPAVNAWYRRMQAAMLVKNCLVALHAGSKRLMTGWAVDAQEPWAIPPLSNSGLLTATFRKLWPAGHTYKLLIEKLGSIRSIRRVKTPEGIFVYQILLADQRKVLVAFADDFIGQNHDQPHATVEASIPFSKADSALVTHIIADIDQTEARVERVGVVNGRIQMQLTEIPVIIEEG